METEAPEPFLVVRPKKFTLEERGLAIRTIIGGNSDDDKGNKFFLIRHSKVISTHRSKLLVFTTGSLDRGVQDRAIVPATGVPEAWSEYLRENIPPRGWLAVWDLKNPEHGEVPVCVDVISVNFKDFEAEIQE